MAGHPLRPATRHRLGGPLPRQLADRPRAPLPAPEVSSPRDAPARAYAVLPGRWAGYPPRGGRSLTCYAPVRRSWVAPRPRLACVKHAASVRPEPGSNSPREFNAQWLSERLSRCSVLARQRVRITQNDQVKTLPEALIGPGSMSSPRTLLRSQARLSNSTNVA